MRKTCARCLIEKDASEFGARPSRKIGIQSYCRPCMRLIKIERYPKERAQILARNKRWRDANKDRVFDNRLLKAFNITREKYDAMLRAQGGVCFICKQPETAKHRNGTLWNLSVDHDHSCCPSRGRSCGRCVRWLLCTRCNVVMGFVGDDAALLLTMASAVASWKSPAKGVLPCLTA